MWLLRACLAIPKLAIASVLPGSDFHVGLAKVTVWSLLATTYFLYTSAYFCPRLNQDFLDYAEAIVGQRTLPGETSQRDSGYPLLLIATGYTCTHSFIGMTIAHALFALGMPILVYLIVGQTYPRAAFVAALATIVSAAPYQFMKWIHHDQLFIFLTILLVYLVTVCARSESPLHLYTITLTAIAATVTRPAGNAIFLFVLGVLAVVKPRQYKHLLACIAIYTLTMFGYVAHRDHLFPKKEDGTRPSYTGQQLFYNLYLSSPEMPITITENVGPHTKALVEKYRKVLGSSPRESSFLNAWIQTEGVGGEAFLRGQFGFDTTDELITHMFAHPNWEYYQAMCEAVKDDALFAKASKEIMLAHPEYSVWIALRNFTRFQATPGWVHSRGNIQMQHQEGLFFLPAGYAVDKTPNLPDHSYQELAFNPLEHNRRLKNSFKRIETTWEAHYRVFLKVSYWLMCISLVSVTVLALSALLRLPWTATLSQALSGRELALSVIVSYAILFYNAAVTCAFVEPSYRYHHFIIIFQIICAGFGLAIPIRLALALVRYSKPSTAPSEPAPVVANENDGGAITAITNSWDRLFADRHGLLFGGLAFATVLCFGSWAVYVCMHVYR